MAESADPILAASSDRLCLFPLRYPDLWDMYKRASAAVWFSEEVDLAVWPSQGMRSLGSVRISGSLCSGLFRPAALVGLARPAQDRPFLDRG